MSILATLFGSKSSRLGLEVSSGIDAGRRLVFCDRTVTVGLAKNNSLVLNDPAIQDCHLKVSPSGRDWNLEAFPPAFALLDGEQMRHAKLREGQHLRLSKTTECVVVRLPASKTKSLAAAATAQSTGAGKRRLKVDPLLAVIWPLVLAGLGYFFWSLGADSGVSAARQRIEVGTNLIDFAKEGTRECLSNAQLHGVATSPDVAPPTHSEADVAATYYRAAMLNASGEMSDEALDRLAERITTQTRQRLVQAQLYQKRGHWDEALSRYGLVLHSMPNIDCRFMRYLAGHVASVKALVK